MKSGNEMIDFVGYLAGFLTVIGFLPQAIKSWETRKTEDLSLSTGILLSCGAITWTIYGVLLSSMPMMITNVVVLICILSILVIKLVDTL